MELNEREYTCCICGKKFKGFGNNPWPLVSDDKSMCCDECNSEKVIPARIRKILNDCKR